MWDTTGRGSVAEPRRRPQSLAPPQPDRRRFCQRPVPGTGRGPTGATRREATVAGASTAECVLRTAVVRPGALPRTFATTVYPDRRRACRVALKNVHLPEAEPNVGARARSTRRGRRAGG